jgi:hypothetical protein
VCAEQGPAHADQILGAFRRHIGPRHPLSVGIRPCQQHLLPGEVEMAVVPGGVFLDHRPRGGVRRDISGPALAHHPQNPWSMATRQTIPLWRGIVAQTPPIPGSHSAAKLPHRKGVG